MPPTTAGMRIGLFGGSFNPPHRGHLLVAETALRRLGLDRLWWMVTPGSPLKDHGVLAPLGERLALSEALARDPRIDVTAFEAAAAIRFTADTVRLVAARRRDVKFVWVMGADSLATFHRWQDWQFIAAAMPIAVVDRPGSTLSLLSSPMAQRFQQWRMPERSARALPGARPRRGFFFMGRARLFINGIARQCLIRIELDTICKLEHNRRTVCSKKEPVN